MRYPTCQAENLPDALICAECGGKMESPCPACGMPNAAGAKFSAPLPAARLKKEMRV